MMQRKDIEIIARFKNSVVHSYSDGELIFSSKNKIYKMHDLNNPKPQLVCEIPWIFLQKISNIRTFDRFLKNSILQVQRTKNKEYLVTAGNAWWNIDSKGNISKVEKFSNTRPLNRGICETKRGINYVAEYISNPKSSSIKIFRRIDLQTFEVAWKFQKKTIRHVHALIIDPELKNRIWVLTGDSDNESHFYYTDDDFNSLHCFLSAGQKSRATDLIVRKGLLYWGMDSPQEPAYILCASKESPSNLKILHELPGPAYYLAQNEAGGFYVGTTVEKGQAVKDNYGHIFALRPNSSWEEILCCKKDAFPQHGIFYFPKNILPENFLVYSQKALKPYEGYLTIARDKAWF